MLLFSILLAAGAAAGFHPSSHFARPILLAAPVHKPLLVAPEIPTTPSGEAQEMALTLIRPRAVNRIFTLRVTAALVSTVGSFSGAFMLLERWSAIDAFYFVSTTMATIGFGDLRPTTMAGRMLSNALGCLGVGLLGGLVSEVVEEYTQPDNVQLDENAADSSTRRGRMRLELQRLGWLQQVTLLLGIGTLSLKLCERDSISWAKAAYCVIGAVTTAGLGDAVPTSAAAKVFFGFYSPLAVITFARVIGSLAVRPLEAARRVAQRAVLDRYGSKLTKETLTEVARGPMVKRLGLSQNDRFCSRDEFTLLTLVLQGKVTEADLAECRQTFNKLDVIGNGQLSAEDLEVLAQRRMLRSQMNPRFQRRFLARLRSRFGLMQGGKATGPVSTDAAAGQAEGAGTAVPTLKAIQDLVEESFPYWRGATGEETKSNIMDDPGTPQASD